MPQPYLRSKIYPIYAPSRGLVLNAPAPFLDPRTSPDCQNVRYYEQIVETRPGYIDYGDYSAVTGIPIKFYRYQQVDGTEREILATTTNIYHRSSGNPWACLYAWNDAGDDISLDIDHRVSLSTSFLNSKFYLVISSRDYAASKWDGSDYTLITSTAVYKPKIMLTYQFRLLMFNIDEDDTVFPIKFRYSIPNPTDATTDWTATGSAGRNLIQGAGKEIVNAVAIKDYVGVYKDESITVLDYVGGSSIFATAVHIDGVGLLAQDAIVNLGTSHLFLGSDYNIYEWNGGWELIPIGNAVKKYIKDNINRDKKERCFAVPNYENSEAHFFIVIGTNDYPTVYLTYNWEDKTWAFNTIASVSGGGDTKTSGVERTLIGLSGGGIEHYDYSATNDDGVAINSYFTTPDVTIDKEEYKIKNKEYNNVYVDAKGNNLSMQYSLNEGSTYSTIDTDALESTSIYNLHTFNFEKTARNIRFKFANSTLNEKYSCRFVGIEHKDRERK